MKILKEPRKFELALGYFTRYFRGDTVHDTKLKAHHTIIVNKCAFRSETQNQCQSEQASKWSHYLISRQIWHPTNTFTTNMKLFERAVENFAFLGLELDESAEKYSLTKNYLFSQFLCVVCIISSIIFFTYDAKTFYEYIMAFILFSVAVMCTTLSVIIPLRAPKLGIWIETLKSLFEDSKWPSLFIKKFIIMLFISEWIDFPDQTYHQFWPM